MQISRCGLVTLVVGESASSGRNRLVPLEILMGYDWGTDPDDPGGATHKIDFAVATGENSSSWGRLQIAAKELGRFLERPAAAHKLQNAKEFTGLPARRMQVATHRL